MAPRRKPGPKKGQPKPIKRRLDAAFPERIASAMKIRGFLNDDKSLDVPKLAGLAKITRAALHNYLDKKDPPKQIEVFVLFALADALNISARWLLLPNQSSMDKERVLSDDEDRALNTFANLDPDARDEWIRQGEFLSHRQPALIATTARPYSSAKHLAEEKK